MRSSSPLSCWSGRGGYRLSGQCHQYEGGVRRDLRLTIAAARAAVDPGAGGAGEERALRRRPVWVDHGGTQSGSFGCASLGHESRPFDGTLAKLADDYLSQ